MLVCAAIGILLTLTTVSLQSDPLVSSFESATGLAFPQAVTDLACLAHTFPSRFKQQHDAAHLCDSQVLNNYNEIREVHGLVYDPIDQSFISNTYPLLGIKGLHLKLFEQQVDTARYVFVVIRHQEHDSILTDEMNEMMSLFGAAATVDRQQGNREAFSASTVTSMIRYVRQQLGLDYFPQALAMMSKIQLHYRDRGEIKFISSGFSSGGLYAILLALYFHWPAITFASTGVEDIANDYYSELLTSRYNQSVPPQSIFNFAHRLDPIPQLDCQLGTLCLFHADDGEEQHGWTDDELESLHLSTIFGASGPSMVQWLRQRDGWTCSSADRHSSKYGSCQRERLRWKERMESQSRVDDGQEIKFEL